MTEIGNSNMKKKLYIFNASVMIYTNDAIEAVGIVKDLNDLDVPCFIDKGSAFPVTCKESLTDWLHLCPVEEVGREPIFSIHCTEDLLDGVDDDNNIDSERLWKLKQERFELSQKLFKVKQEIEKIASE